MLRWCKMHIKILVSKASKASAGPRIFEKHKGPCHFSYSYIVVQEKYTSSVRQFKVALLNIGKVSEVS